jgi:predicted phosphodiesterase
MSSKFPQYKKDQKTTPKDWKGPPDARSVDGAGTYPNYHSQKTRSGHTFTMDDSEGAESITLQHRSGSMFQCLPDGAMQFVSHNGQYTFVFGENRVQITGAQDITVQGDCSLKVDGDYNMTVQGNHNTTVNGDMNITAKNMNTVVRGNMDTSAKNMTTKIEGSTEITTEGVTNITSHGGMSLSSTGAPMSILSKGNLGLGATGKVMFHAGGAMHVKTDTNMVMSSGGTFTMKGFGNMALDGGSRIDLNDGKAQEADDMAINIPVPTNPNPAAGGPR